MSEINFENILERTQSIVPVNQDMANLFLSDSDKIQRFIVGRNELSKDIIDQIDINGIVDDFEVVRLWNSIPVIKISDLPKDAFVLNCSTSISPVSVIKNLKRCGINNIISYHELYYASKGKIRIPSFIKEFQADYQKYKGSWKNIFDKLEDQESKQTLLDVMNYRFTGNPDFMNNYIVRLKDQYMEGFLNISQEIFVDIGGYDGDTTQEFCNRFPDYQKVIFFEPSPKNMKLAKKRLSGFNNILFKPLGLSDKSETLGFDPHAGSSSTILLGEEIIDTIKVVTLDDEIKEKVSLIKMDIEGWEIKALEGAKKHISNDKPKLAIAVYHRASDFREIFDYILGINPAYKVYLRHYTQGWSETVMFFV